MDKATTETAIRTVEREVLDRAHLRFRIFSENEDTATLAVLRMYENIRRSIIAREAKQGSGFTYDTIMYITRQQRGLSHCLRWIRAETTPGVVDTTRDVGALEPDALDLLQWATTYEDLARDHIAWSNGLASATIDESARRISFFPQQGIDALFILRQQTAEHEAARRLLSAFPRRAAERLRKALYRASTFDRGIEWDASLVTRHPLLLDIVKWMSSIVFPEVDGDFMLGHYSLTQFRVFAATLFVHCDYVARLEEEEDFRLGFDENDLQSSIFILPGTEAIDWLVQATGLPTSAVQAICADLTLNTTRFRSLISNTPIILTRSNTFMLSPREFTTIAPSRMLAGALTGGAARGHYDRLSTTLERKRLYKIHKTLIGLGLQVRCEPRVRTSDGGELTPDLVVWDDKENVIVMDFKNAVVPHGASDVANRLREYDKAIAQVNAYEQALNGPELQRITGRNLLNTRLVKCILLWSPMPIHVSIPANTYVDSWINIKPQLQSHKTLSIDDLLALFTGHPSNRVSDDAQIGTREISVGDWTYVRHVLRVPQRYSEARIQSTTTQ